MPFESVLRTDILSEDLTTDQRRVSVVAEHQFKNIVSHAERFTRTTSPEPAKTIVETMALIKQAIEDYDNQHHTTEDAKVVLLYEEPAKLKQLEAITIKLIKREPGMYGQGSPFENSTRQLKPILREVKDDTEEPGYKRAVLGQFYDNMLRLTCWARTNKTANDRALWLETVMEDYAWFFVYSGVNRILYQGRGPEETIKVEDNYVYGRAIDYYVRTEKLRSISQKELEEIVVRLALSAGIST